MPAARRLPAPAAAGRANRRSGKPEPRAPHAHALRVVGEGLSSQTTASCGPTYVSARADTRVRPYMMSRRPLRDLVEEAGAVRHRADAKDLGQRLPQIREREAGAEVGATANMGAGSEQRHVLARVIGTGGGRIVAMIRGHDEE